jgi:hypothetical protein
MTPKSRKRSAKKSARKAAGKTSRTPSAKAKGGSAVKRVLATAVLKREAPSPNTSAFKTPARLPGRLEAMDVRARKRLVTKLIPRPVPTPSADVAKAVTDWKAGKAVKK